MIRKVAIFSLLLLLALASYGQRLDSSPKGQVVPGSPTWIANNFIVAANITYLTAHNYSAKLDLYRPVGIPTPAPVVVYIHGGGWVAGTKEDVALGVLPFLEMGFAVINVEYRLAHISPAPAAVEDCLCVLHWLGRNAKEFNLDLQRVVVAGASAGGHLALTTAMIPTSAGLENACANADDASGGAGDWPNQRAPVAAVINWFGITDVADLIHGPNVRAYALSWVGSQPDAEEIAKRVSPLSYVRPGLPAILTIHGDQDKYVPYQHAVRLHAALEKAGVKNELMTMPGGGHGGFTAEQDFQMWEKIKQFLASVGISPVTQASHAP
jgi:acetyl esterase/lipase